jgi:hypothetical protein
MKTFRVALSIGGVVFIDAERFERAEGFVRFYRGDSMIAEYPSKSVKEDITEKVLTQRVPPWPGDGGAQE